MMAVPIQRSVEMADRYTRWLLLAALAMVGGTMHPLAQAAKIDVTGKWQLTVESAAGTSTPSLTLKQDGEKLTGHYTSATLGEHDVTGTVKGKDIKFSFKADLQGTELEVTYAGTIEDKDTMKGTLDLGGLGNATFTAKRQ